MSNVDRIYAFYEWIENGNEKKLVKETMADHVDAALEAVEEMRWSIEGWKHLSPDFEILLRIAVLLHDIGKTVYNIYLFESYKDLRFPGHEIVSAWIAYKLFYEKSDLRKMLESSWIYIVFAIANHHHPMGIFSRCQAIPKGLLSKKLDNAVSLFVKELRWSERAKKDEALREVLSYLEKIDQKVRDIEIAEVCQSICGKGNVLQAMDSLWLYGDARKRKAALLLTQALVLADYRAASKNRVGKGRGFEEIVRLFFELNRALSQVSLDL